MLRQKHGSVTSHPFIENYDRTNNRPADGHVGSVGKNLLYVVTHIVHTRGVAGWGLWKLQYHCLIAERFFFTPFHLWQGIKKLRQTIHCQNWMTEEVCYRNVFYHTLNCDIVNTVNVHWVTLFRRYSHSLQNGQWRLIAGSPGESRLWLRHRLSHVMLQIILNA